MAKSKTIWLAAQYHCPTTYACRVPLSSAYSTQAMPAPGPATVRLAMVRVGIEIFGKPYVRDKLYPSIRAAEVQIRPPDSLAMSTQFQRAHKTGGNKNKLVESVAMREMCHAEGVITIYITTPPECEQDFRAILDSIGYWGQSSSLVQCVAIECKEPTAGTTIRPLQSFSSAMPVEAFFTCVVSEFRDKEVPWKDIMPTREKGQKNPLQLQLYIWPLQLIEQHSTHRLLRYGSLE